MESRGEITCLKDDVRGDYYVTDPMITCSVDRSGGMVGDEDTFMRTSSLQACSTAPCVHCSHYEAYSPYPHQPLHATLQHNVSKTSEHPIPSTTHSSTLQPSCYATYPADQCFHSQSNLQTSSNPLLLSTNLPPPPLPLNLTAMDHYNHDPYNNNNIKINNITSLNNIINVNNKNNKNKEDNNNDVYSDTFRNKLDKNNVFYNNPDINNDDSNNNFNNNNSANNFKKQTLQFSDTDHFPFGVIPLSTPLKHYTDHDDVMEVIVTSCSKPRDHVMSTSLTSNKTK